MKYHMKHQLEKLANGAQIILAPQQEARTTAILVGVRVGSRDEADSQAGMAHFVEHMFFKGTKKRPSYLDISRDLDALGANYNAFTSHEMTGLYIQSAAEKQRESAEILFDLLLNSIFPSPEIAKEKQVIGEEINMYEDMPQEKVMLEFQELMFSGSSLGRPIAGYKETVAGTERSGLSDFVRLHYIPSNMTAAIAGKIDKETIKFIKGKILSGRQGEKSEPLPYPKFIRTNTEQNKTISKNIDQAHIALGFPAFGNTDPRRFALNILTGILGGMMSSRLFVEVREKLGLAYYVSTGASLFMDTGTVLCRAGLNKTKLEIGLQAIRREIEKFKLRKVSDQELGRAKDNFKGHFFLGLEDSLDTAQFYLSQQLLQGEILEPEEIVKRIEKVSQNDILALANQIFDEKKEKLVVVR